MKNLFYLIITASILVFSQCDKDEKTPPPYIGTWQDTFDTTYETVPVKGKRQFTFTENTWNLLVSAKHPILGIEITVSEASGTMSVNGEEITITVSNISIVDESLTMQHYNAGEPGFDEALETIQMSASLNGNISVSGNQLFLKIDFDKDNSYSEEEEATLNRV